MTGDGEGDNEGDSSGDVDKVILGGARDSAAVGALVRVLVEFAVVARVVPVALPTWVVSTARWVRIVCNLVTLAVSTHNVNAASRKSANATVKTCFLGTILSF